MIKLDATYITDDVVDLPDYAPQIDVGGYLARAGVLTDGGGTKRVAQTQYTVVERFCDYPNRVKIAETQTQLFFRV